MSTQQTNPMANEPSPDMIAEKRIYADWGLTDHEYDLIVDHLGRRPNYTEAGIFLECGQNTALTRSQSQPCGSSGQKMTVFCKDLVKGLGFWTLGMAKRSSLRPKVTTTHLSLNHMKGLQLELVAFCATFSQWVLNQLPFWTHCALVNWTMPRPGKLLTA